MATRAEYTADQLAQASTGPDDQSKYRGLRMESAKTLSSLHFMSQFIELADSSDPLSTADPVPEEELSASVHRAEVAAQAALEGQGDLLGAAGGASLEDSPVPSGNGSPARTSPLAGDPFAGIWALKESVDALVRRLDRMEAHLATPGPTTTPPSSDPAPTAPASEPGDPYPKHPSQVPSLGARREQRTRAAGGTMASTDPPGTFEGAAPFDPTNPNCPYRESYFRTLQARVNTLLPSPKTRQLLWFGLLAAAAVGVVWTSIQGQTVSAAPPSSIETAFQGMAKYVRMEAELLKREVEAPDLAQKRIHHLRELHGLASSEQERAAIESQLRDLLNSQDAIEARAQLARTGLVKLQRVSRLRL